MEKDEYDIELSKLRADRARLREERDSYRKDLEDLVSTKDKAVSDALRLLAISLAKDIREEFFGKIKQYLYLAAILVAIATLGGYLKLSDIISTRIDAKVEAKAKEIERLRTSVIDAVVDFEKKSREALNEISQMKQQVASESEKATTEIRTRVSAITFGIGSEGTVAPGFVPSVSSGPSGSPWFGVLSSDFIGIAGSRPDQYGADDASARMGAFSAAFQQAFRTPSADKNRDNLISFEEAVQYARERLKSKKYEQYPVIEGPGASVAIFKTLPSSPIAMKYRTAWAILVGVSKYKMPHTDLIGPENDAKGFASLLEDKDRVLATTVHVTVLANENATQTAILSAIVALESQTSAEDAVIIYFSGHVSSAKGTERNTAVKILAPYDMDWDKHNYIEVPKVVAMMQKLKARNKIMVIDG